MSTKHSRTILMTAALAGMSALTLPSSARADDPIQNLHQPAAHDYGPTPGIIVGADGNFYGTAAGYGDVNGSVWELSADGKTYTTIYPFTGQQEVTAGIAEGPDGNLYGTINAGVAPMASGAVFKVTKAGVFSTLHTFTGDDGANPAGPLVIATDGTIYGTTFNGGAGVGTGSGTVFSIDATGKFSTYYDFADDDETIVGKNPVSRLVLTTDGSLYGTTSTSGANGAGTVFHIPPGNDPVEAVSLDTSIGAKPHDLLKACDGYFYGRAVSGNGVIFRLDIATGALAVLHSLTQGEGSLTYGGETNLTGGALIEGRNHRLYVVAEFGGTGGGSLFSLGLDGAFAPVTTANNRPWGVVQGTDGNLYGTSQEGYLYGVTLPAAERVAAGCPSMAPTTGAAGTTGTTGAGGAAAGTAGTGGGAAGTTGSAGTSGPSTGAAGATGAAGTTGASGSGTGAAGTAGDKATGGKSGGCALAGDAAVEGRFALVVVGLVGLLALRRRRSREGRA